MAAAARKTKVTANKARLIAVDGVEAATVIAEARRVLGSPTSGGISHWDASGVFQDLGVAAEDAGAPSARTLLLLYAADLAFRLRWEIRPALAEGRAVVAAPYVDTALAFGRAAGLPAGWLTNLFRFAPRPAERVIARPSGKQTDGKVDGFVGFVCKQITGKKKGRASREIVERTAAQLGQAALRSKKSR
jgi:hypothetical protein